MPDASDKVERDLFSTRHFVLLTEGKRDPTFPDRLPPAGSLLRRCIQCGTCSASCPSVHAMDITPRRMWRLAQLGLQDEVLHSNAIWLCSLCYMCHVRCPRGIPLTETIVKLKEMALKEGVLGRSASAAFYKSFAAVMRRYGRMRELELMVRFFIAGNPLSALGFAKLGITMLIRGKAHLEIPSFSGEGRLDRLFVRVAELEAQR